ncbi:MAG: hypothetical protein WCI20_11060 [bacterium]
MNEITDEIVKDFVVPGLSALLGALVGYYVALRTSKYSEQMRVLGDFKTRLVPFIHEIQGAPENDPTSVVEKCVAETDAYFVICASLLDRAGRNGLTKLWDEFKCKNEDGDYDFAIGYWAEANHESVQKSRKTVLDRLHKLMTFEIKI